MDVVHPMNFKGSWVYATVLSMVCMMGLSSDKHHYKRTSMWLCREEMLKRLSKQISIKQCRLICVLRRFLEIASNRKRNAENALKNFISRGKTYFPCGISSNFTFAETNTRSKPFERLSLRINAVVKCMYAQYSCKSSDWRELC